MKVPEVDPPSTPVPPLSSVPISMRTRQVTTAFADDPIRSSPVHISQRDIEALNGPNHLSTNLMDYIIQKVVGKDRIPDEYLIGSSNAMSYFTAMNQYDFDSTNPGDVRTALTLRRKYQMYSLKNYKFLALNCSSNHFFVVSLRFDIKTTRIFQQVVVFDSLRHSAQGKDVVLSTSIAGKMLMSLQLFLAKFCFFAHVEQSHDLIRHPECILEDATYVNCPQQRNGYDCGLFGLGVLFHLVDGQYPLDTTFGQKDVDLFRAGLHRELKGVRRHLNWNVISSFFPSLRVETEQKVKNPKMNEIVEIGKDMDDNDDNNNVDEEKDKDNDDNDDLNEYHDDYPG